MKDHSSGRSYSSDFKLLSGLFFRLLPYQVLLIAINAVNNIIDRRRTYFASLSLEEMAGNVVQHGFKKRQ